jgi:hypothetical protein
VQHGSKTVVLDDVKDASLRSRRKRRAAPVLDLVCARR